MATHLIEEDGTHSPNCFPCKLASINFAPSAMPNRNPNAARAAVKDPLLDKDRAAYKRLRREGEQPKHVEGSAYLEAKANESFEITTGQVIPDATDRKDFAIAFEDMPTKPRVRTSPDQPPRRRRLRGDLCLAGELLRDHPDRHLEERHHLGQPVPRLRWHPELLPQRSRRPVHLGRTVGQRRHHGQRCNDAWNIWDPYHYQFTPSSMFSNTNITDCGNVYWLTKPIYNAGTGTTPLPDPMYDGACP